MPSFFQVLIPFAVVLFFGLVLLLIIRINTIAHEFGHALAMHRLAKGPITVFLGSYGNKERSWLIRAGRFNIWFRKNPFRWWGGLCMHEEQDIPTRSQVIYTVAGPLSSLLLFVCALMAFIRIDAQGLLAPILTLFWAYSLIDFLANVLPRDTAVMIDGDLITYNDGKRLQQLLTMHRMPPAFFEAAGHYEAGDFKLAADILESLLAGGLKKRDVYRCAVDASLRAKTYVRADAILKEQISRYGVLNMHDKMQLGLLKICLGDYGGAIGYLKHLLELEGPNKFNLNNLGYALTITGHYEEAIPYLTKAISIDGDFGYAYANRGYALLQLGQLDEGKTDIDRGWALNPETAHGYRNQGVYCFQTKDYPAALTAFEQAIALENDIPGLDKLIEETLRRLSSDLSGLSRPSLQEGSPIPYSA